MARAFVAATPPRTPVLTTYGDEFADFIAAFEPARELAYLADVARLEAARTHAYHAADAVSIDAKFSLPHLTRMKLVTFASTCTLSAEIICSRHPIVTIWMMNCSEREPAPIEDWHGEDALVVRPHFDVEVRLLPTGGATFLLALAERTIGQAVEAAFAEHPAFDLSATLAVLIRSGVAVDVIAP